MNSLNFQKESRFTALSGLAIFRIHGNTDEAQTLSGYKPQFNIDPGLTEATEWHWQNFHSNQ